MEIRLTPAAREFVFAQGESAITVSSLLFSSCCSGPLPPEVKPGAPADASGFTPFTSSGLTVYYDSLLEPRPQLTVALRDYGSYRELVVQDWE